MKPEYLVRGLPGHPIHPPLTDLTIGTYTFATIAAVGDVTGILENNAAYSWWIALLVGLAGTAVTALTGFVDWLQITWRTPLWWTTTWHALSQATAGVFFGLAAIFGHGGYLRGDVTAGSFVLTLLGFGFLLVGGWLGGTVVFVHGMRVLGLVDEPTERAAAPVPFPEKEESAGG